MSVTVRPARPEDAAAIHKFVRDLAEHHEHLEEAKASLDDIRHAFFGPQPYAVCEMAEQDGQLLGFATWFYTFSSWTGRKGVYLEDLFVRDDARGTGAGRALMVSLAKRCAAEDLPRIEWAVMRGNTGGEAFYSRLGAAPQDHAIWRMDGAALAALGR